MRRTNAFEFPAFEFPAGFGGFESFYRLETRARVLLVVVDARYMTSNKIPLNCRHCFRRHNFEATLLFSGKFQDAKACSGKISMIHCIAKPGKFQINPISRNCEFHANVGLYSKFL